MLGLTKGRGGKFFALKGASVITVVFPEWYAQLTEEEAAKPINRFKFNLTILMYRKVLGIDWDDMVVAYISDDHPEYEGLTIPEAAKREGLSELDMYLKLVKLSNRAGSIYLGKYYNAEIVRTLMENLAFVSTTRLVPKSSAGSSIHPNSTTLSRRSSMKIGSSRRKARPTASPK